MADKILGLDLGTNSIGWAIVEKTEDGYSLLDKGVNIFKDGVDYEKNIERPAVQTRTQARALRRHYFRRRLRKIELLKILVQYGFCPELSEEQLMTWKKEKEYPLVDEFMLWQRTDDNEDKNPYHDRYICLFQKLDLSVKKDRYTLGRALYHLAQRRGFLSNRKDTSKSSEDGLVKQSISALSKEIKDAGCTYLGEYFYKLYQEKKKIRKHYTSRNEHYKAEFNAICEKQKLSDELRNALERAIFFQRPLKSQKGLVGKCVFEKRKARCPESHPRFEEFRMLQFINNIGVVSPSDTEYRPLNDEEGARIHHLFFRKSKRQFDFEDIAKEIAGKKTVYGDKNDPRQVTYRFNYRMSTTVSGCPVTASLRNIFGKGDEENWVNEMCSQYLKAGSKTKNQIVDDVWHALFSFDDESKLKQWAETNLQLSEEEAKAFIEIHIPQGYASLSLNAIGKILPYLRSGYRYDEAVFMANLKSVLPMSVWNDPDKRNSVIYDIASLIEDFYNNPLNKHSTKEIVIASHLRSIGIEDKYISRLYHPSSIDAYPTVQPNEQGIYQLGSPRIASIKNPMAMRALFRLRILVNQLLKEGKIDKQTKINIEFARGLNDANMRKAIQQYQRDNEKKHKEYADSIRKLFKAEGKDVEPTETDILKYQLWEEQNHICLYTGETISVSSFIGNGNVYDIEHTVPRSRNGDNSQVNKTLCDWKFNRETKKAQLPAELSNYQDIIARIEGLGWEEKIRDLQKNIELQVRVSRNASTKEEKDRAIQRKHYLKFQLNYLKSKLETFKMAQVPEGFSNRQGVDIGIIGKYAHLYLKSVFDKVYTVKGATTAEFRKMWGLQDEYAKKERVNHVHHCIDAVTIACIGKNEYDKWAQFTADTERFEFGMQSSKPVFPKPWPTFTEDVKKLTDEILVYYREPDKMKKQTKKKLRIRGKVQFGEGGLPKYVQGDSARGSLHLQTFYGAVKRDDAIKYVTRKALDQVEPTSANSVINNIVDDVVREKVKEAVKNHGNLKNAVAAGIWMNEEKRIPINKVRVYCNSVTDPIILKKQRDPSSKEYRESYYVANESNYCMAIYEGKDVRGKVKRDFKLINNYIAAHRMKMGRSDAILFPQSSASGLSLKCCIKPGTLVLLYEKSPSELLSCSKSDLVSRLYRVVGLSSSKVNGYVYGRITMVHHQEGRPSSDLKVETGTWKKGERLRPSVFLYHTQFNALTEGEEFCISSTGEIRLK